MTIIPDSGRVAVTVDAIADDFASLVSRGPRASIKNTVDAVKAAMPNTTFVDRARLGDTLATMEGVLGVALDITATPVTTGTNAVAYAGFTATATGGVSPYVYSLQGTWPAGIEIDDETGEVSGTPTEDGAFTLLSVRATDNRGETADIDTFTLTVAGA